jgi:type III secretion protein V
MPGWRKLMHLLSKAEVAPALVVLSAAAILILPVPAFLMDLLLSLNISFAVIMLLLSIRVGAALKVAAFPTMLLISTLFRLSLNVSTTRLILSHGDAGEVVKAFGSFVTMGNPLVGGVLFLILTLVQFIVIAKGAERVAEVTARFTLDAMPGKQMSIDADLRAGLLDQNVAAHKRAELEREAQFHGSMDGAMKFVKGDAVAGMAITLVNLLGGLMVGCLQRGLSASDAMVTYTVLTIGDGLVSQIPALLISVSAGLVVTRVKAEQAEHGLGRQIASQVGAHPEVLLFSGATLILIGLAPGMPQLSFGVLGLGLGSLGFYLGSRDKARAEQEDSGTKAGPSELSLVLPSALLQDEQFYVSVEQLRAKLQGELGIQLPCIDLQPDDTKQSWSLLIDEAPASSGRMGPPAQFFEALEMGLRRSAARFVGVQETQNLLDGLEGNQPVLVREVVPRLVPPVMLSEILGRLVEEQVSVRNLRGILACLAEWARSEADPMVLAERVRERLRASITYTVAPEGQLSALLLDPELEQMIQEAMEENASGSSLAIHPQQAERVLQGLELAIQKAGAVLPVVLCRPEIRRPFWKLVSAFHPLLKVISFLELEPSVAIQPIGRIGLGSGKKGSQR